MPSARETSLRSVAAIIADYRQGEIPPPDAEHVGRWLAQFDPEDQPVLLSELELLLPRLYLSRVRCKSLLHAFLERLIDGRDPEAALRHVQFLRLQTRGGSQAALVELVEEVLREEFGFDAAGRGAAEPHTFLYLDDAIYTGNRLRYDLMAAAGRDAGAWIETAPPGSGLILYTLVTHLDGWRYAWGHLERAAYRRDVHVSAFHGLALDNARVRGGLVQCLWPERGHRDPFVDEYVSRLVTARGGEPWFLFREPGTPPFETLFSSPSGRRIVERALLRAGAFLHLNCAVAPHQRPLGYEVLESLGFGSLFVTYRNIANNCPLALWWSRNPDVWYPLFPRRVNP